MPLLKEKKIIESLEYSYDFTITKIEGLTKLAYTSRVQQKTGLTPFCIRSLVQYILTYQYATSIHSVKV